MRLHLRRFASLGILGGDQICPRLPPCKEYSRLKLRPGGPSAVRTPEHLGGLPSNTPAQQSRVISSQKLLYRSVCILQAVFSAGGHVSLEQPTNAMSWLEPFAQNLLSEFQARLVNIPACTAGQDRAKSWLFACSYTLVARWQVPCSRFLFNELLQQSWIRLRSLPDSSHKSKS